MQIHNAVITGSFSYNGADLSNVTSSNQSSASLSARVTQIEQVYATTGSNSFRATQSITGSLTVTGQITAQTLNVQQVTSSIVYSSGSNVFGCDLNSRQTFTGSVLMTGSLIVNTSGTELQVNNNGVTIGNLQADNHSITGSLRVTGSLTSFSGCVGIGGVIPTRALDVNGTLRIVTPNRSFFVTSNAYSISDGTLSSGIGMDGDGLYLGNVASSTGWTISNPQVTIRCSGNVGIGQPNPQSILEVNGGNTYFPCKIITLSGAEATRYNGFIGLNLVGGSQLAMSLGTRSNNTDYASTLNLYQGHVGIGVTPSPWASGTTALQIGNTVTLWNRASDGLLVLGANSYFNGSADIQITNGTSNRIYFVNGGIVFDRAACTAAGSNTPWQTSMNITSGGNLLIGGPTDTAPRLAVKGVNNSWAGVYEGGSTTGQSYGLYINAGSNSTDSSFYVQNQSGTTVYFRVRGDGYLQSPTTYNNTTATAANLSISTSGFIERSTSSIKYKKEVRNYDKGLAEILQLRPVYYKGKGENDGNKEFAGLIAEEVDEVGLNEFVTYAEDGSPDALAYQNMVSLLVKGMQQQQCTINALKTCLGIS